MSLSIIPSPPLDKKMKVEFDHDTGLVILENDDGEFTSLYAEDIQDLILKLKAFEAEAKTLAASSNYKGE